MEKNNVLKTKICCACKKSKEIESFYRNSNSKDNYEARCKMCKTLKFTCQVGAKKKLEDDKFSSSFKLNNVSKKEWILMYSLLSKIGYNVKDDVHTQFCNKHDLKTKERGFERIKVYSKKELGIV